MVSLIATSRNASVTTISDTGSKGKFDAASWAAASGNAQARDIAVKTAKTDKLKKTSIREDFID